uniref:Zf-CHCC domain-containing protein n=1 Tax=Trichuris muris TaxID=70415 RepID=A0A5S6QB29_TRIMR
MATLLASFRVCRRNAALLCTNTKNTGGAVVPKRLDEVKIGIDKEELNFDTVTHTGQAWDQYDARRVRFELSAKQVNPNIAMHLIAAVPPIPCTSREATCDGGGGALGHPKVFINLDKPGYHACGYCGLRFFNVNVKPDGSQHIQV